MKHLFHIHEKAELLKKQLTEEASEKEELQAEKLLTEHPRLNEEIKKLRNKKELERTFHAYSRYSSKDAYQHFLQKNQYYHILTQKNIPMVVCRSGCSNHNSRILYNKYKRA